MFLGCLALSINCLNPRNLPRCSHLISFTNCFSKSAILPSISGVERGRNLIHEDDFEFNLRKLFHGAFCIKEEN